MSLKSKLRQFTYTALAVFLSFTAAKGQVVGYIASHHPRYKLIATIPGAILDTRGQEILYQTIDGVIASTNLASKTSSAPLATNNFWPRPTGLFLPTGALVLTDQAVQIDSGDQISLGSYTWFPDFTDRIVEGRFAILRTPAGLLLRDFVSRTNCVIPEISGPADVASNGNVVFVTINDTNKTIRWFHDGGTDTIRTTTSYEIPYVATDGTNVLWSEPQIPFGTVFLRTSSEIIELSTNTFLASSESVPTTVPRFISVVMKNGWLIFPRWAESNPGTANNLWRRGPDGSITQITTAPGGVLAMRDDGGLLISGGDGRIESAINYISPSGAHKAISPDFPLSRFYSVDDKFYAYGPLESAAGAGIYEVEVEQDPFGILYPTYNSQSQQFSCYLFPSVAGDYELQRSDDFITWTTLATVSAESANLSYQIQVSTVPGYFRLHRF